MNKSARVAVAVIIALGALTGLAGSAKAWYSCGQYDSWSGNGYTVYNDSWGSAGQCLSVNNQGSWTAYANFSGGGIKSFPDTSFYTSNQSLNQNSINVSYGLSVPGDAAYDVIFDDWSNNDSDEIMIWENWTSGIGPLSYNYGCSGYPSTACPIYTNQWIDGASWNVFQGNNGHNVVSFMRTSGWTNSPSQNQLAFFQWAANHGLMVNQSINQVQAGVEVTSTNGSESFSMNYYSVSYGSSSGGGSGSGYSSNISNGNHAVVPQNDTGARLDANGWSANNGTKVQIWNGSTQTWAFNNRGGGVYQISEAWSPSACLDVYNGGGSGTNVDIWGCWGGSMQQWGAINDYGSVYEFEPQCARGTRLDVVGGQTGSGTQVDIWSANGGSNQKWAVN